MQRYSQIEFHFVIRHFFYHLGNPYRGDRDSFSGHAQAFLVSDFFDGRRYVGIIQQGLTHAHEDNVCQRAAKKQISLFFYSGHLIINFIGT